MKDNILKEKDMDLLIIAAVFYILGQETQKKTVTIKFWKPVAKQQIDEGARAYFKRRNTHLNNSDSDASDICNSDFTN